MNDKASFIRPTLVERCFNVLFGALVARGIGFRHSYVLENKGRLTGQMHRTPVDLLDYEGQLYLVAPRSHTQWVRNLRATPTLSLQRGGQRHHYLADEVPPDRRVPLLSAYLTQFRNSVQRYFTVSAGSPLAQFAAIANAHPIFGLTATTQNES